MRMENPQIQAFPLGNTAYGNSNTHISKIIYAAPHPDLKLSQTVASALLRKKKV